MSASPTRQDLLRQLPRVDDLIDHDGGQRLVESYSRPTVLAAIRRALGALRADLLGRESFSARDLDRVDPLGVLEAVGKRLARLHGLGLCGVVNATGVILHTGLGRAPLSDAAQAAISEVARGYSLLEVNRASGERGTREQYVDEVLQILTGAEAATVVNNNAAATLLILAALTRGKEVICSRGQLVEIGGSFRIPEVMAESGATLVAVGATNKTHLRDYANAITDNTGALLRVHTSNYRIVGFSQEVPTEELAKLGAERGIPVIDDLGSGALFDLAPYGLPGEPLVGEVLAQGASICCFSGDKLLGGPQAGLIVGQRDLVARCRRHPLFRAVRPDKMTLAGVEATLKLLLNVDALGQTHTGFRMLTESADVVRPRADALAERLRGTKLAGLTVDVVSDFSQPGSGSLPTTRIPTWVVRVCCDGVPAVKLGNRLRRHSPPVFTRISDERVHLDPRTLLPGDDDHITSALTQALA